LSSVNFEPVESQFAGDRAASPRGSLAQITERAAGCFLLTLAAPAIAASAAVVKLLSRRSPFIAHLRVGLNGKPFWTLKLRTMWDDREESGSARWIKHIVAEPEEDGKHQADPRISSRFAAFCRKHSIDELPQLWHVARGEMSLVGPRPLTQSEVSRYYGAQAAELLSVKPGLTGLWQVYGRSAIRFPQRSAMDLEMVRSLDARLYLKILIRTIPVIIAGNGAW
jgi:lipopolysaccharide/colanic/teichoic acid biosynthesis glycosyltransferase